MPGLPPGFDLLFNSDEEAAGRVLDVDLPPDVLTAVGWDGAVNYLQPKSLLSSVLRSWEERFGARVTEIGFDTLHLTVAAPPITQEHAELVAAEHFAFCPDNVMQGMSGGTVRAYAAQEVQGKTGWSFWWD